MNGLMCLNDSICSNNGRCKKVLCLYRMLELSNQLFIEIKDKKYKDTGGNVNE